MKNLDQVIAEHPFFATMAPEHLAVVSGCAKMAAFEVSDFLFRAGAEAEHFFLIRHGRVALELQAPGREPFRFSTADAGEVIGWSWLFPPYRWQFDARALEKTSAVQFDGKCLRGKCEADPELGYQVMKRFAQVLVDRFVDARLQLVDVYGKQR